MSDFSSSETPARNRSHAAWPMLEKLGTLGALLSAVVAPCCFPLFATVAGVLGLGSIPFLRDNASALIQTMTVVAVVGQVAAYRQHRKKGPLLASVVSAGLVAWAYYLSYNVILIYVALVGLAIASVWNVLNGRRCGGGIKRDSVLTCPHCGKQSREKMPTDACLFFYNCPGCGARLKPKPGHCCVFCSYGSVKCPPIQAESGCPPCNCES